MCILKFSAMLCIAFFIGSGIATDIHDKVIASSFVKQYYQTFDENRSHLAMLYVSYLIRF